MSENSLKDIVLTLKEQLKELKLRIRVRMEKINDVLSENVFVSGYENLYLEGMSTYSKGRFKRAIFYFEKALKEKSRDFKCLYNLALSYQADNRFEDAIQCYTRALKEEPEEYDTIYNLGLCYLNVHNGELAEQYLADAVSRDEKDTSAKMSYILALVENKKTDEAIAETIQIVKSNKSFLGFTLTVAKYIESLSFGEKDVENITKVIKLLNSYVKINNKNSNAHLQISMCYGKLGNWDLALKHSMQALELTPKSFEINSHTGLVLYCSHNYHEALEFYEKALSLCSSNNFDIHYNIALTYEKLGQKTNAVKKLKYILKRFKNHPQSANVKALMESIKTPLKDKEKAEAKKDETKKEENTQE